MKISGIIFFCFFSFLTFGSKAIGANLDSLSNVIATTDDIEVKIETKIELGLQYRLLAMDTAVVIFNDAIDMATRKGNRELAARAAMELTGHYAFVAENTEKAHEVAAKARDLISYLGDTSQLYLNYAGRTEMYAGMYESDCGNYTEAQEYYLEALTYYEKLDEKRSALFAYNQLTVLYSLQNMLIEAENILSESILLCQENEWHHEETIFQSNRGYVQYQLGKFTESIATMKLSEQLVLTHTDSTNYYSLIFIYNTLGDNFYELEEYDSSYFYHLKGLYCSEQLKIPSSLISSYSMVSKDCCKRGELKLAESYCEKLQLELDAVQSEVSNLIGYQSWIIYYKASGQYEKAMNKMDTLLVHKEALINEQSIQEQTAQKMDFEFEKDRLLSENEIELRNEMIESEKGYSSRLRIGLWVLIGLLLGFIYLFYSNFKQRKTISEKNKKLEESVHEKETLLKEIHHRVKNNLQLVSSLLGLQAESIDDEQVLSVFEEGQTRVQAMALVHQKLYQNDGATEIDFADYLNGLAGHFSEINTSDKKVEVEIDCEDIKLDIDTAIPLGLIINELFTNAYKHAFATIELPKLSISIKNEGEGEYIFRMADNGQGLPKDLDWSKTKTFGLRLIRNLVKQLIGKIDYEYEDELSVFSIQFKNELGRNLLE